MTDTLFISPLLGGEAHPLTLPSTIAIGLIATALALHLRARKKSRAPGEYHADLAWIRAGVYFCLCWLLSIATGVFDALLQAPQAPGENSSQLAAFTAVLVFEYIAYYRIWAIGTKTLGRPYYPAAVLLFGLLWGLAEAQLFLSFYALSELLGFASWISALICFVLIGAYYGPWHTFYWDIYVAPEHNIEEWNARKVLFVHIPNISFSLAYLVYFKDPHGFLILQCFCLVGACHCMRFPAFNHR